jgi:SAM-dependent methyltransferase
VSYTKPDLRERLKRKIMAGSKGGNPGQWSARKAQLLAAEYEKAGGGYTGARSKAQRSLSRWTKQDWRTKSGKPSLETGERYLPAKAIEKLSASEYAATTRAKRRATGQFSRQPKRIAMKTKRYRNPATPEDMPGPFIKQGSSRDPRLPQKTSPQIDMPAFKRWFAGSVVTTRDGQPRMMFHGTGWTNIREFKSFRAKGDIAGFFAFDPGFAEDFAMLYQEYGTTDFEEDEFGSRKLPAIYPVYLSLKKVFDIRKKEDRDAVEFDSLADRNGWVEGKLGWSWTVMEDRVLIRRMKEQGFDGYIDFEKGSNVEPTGIAVFDPRRVKAAYGNRGTFDPNDPDIRNPATQEDMPPAFKKWFGDSKVVDAKGKPLVVYHGTNKSFTTFKTDRPMWFAVNPELASQFSAGGRRSFGSKPVKGSLVMPVFLRITNPLDLTFAHRWVRLSRVDLMKEIGVDTSEESLRELAKHQLASGYVGVGSHIEDPVSHLVNLYREKDSIYHLLDDPDMVLAMKSKGYDGLMMTESITTGTRSKPTLIKSVTYAVFDATQVKSAYGNRGTFDPMDPDIRNPKDPRSAMTQITGTEDTYIKASKMLGGKVLDYGAGRGIGTDALRSNGLLADSFEPFPKNWEGKQPPTFTDSADIPSASYDSLVSFSVINVVEPDERKFLFQEVARILRPDGVALITGRTRQDVGVATTKIPHLEEGGYLIGKGKLQRYQKGFTQAELERYAKEVLGAGFRVERNPALNGASIKVTKVGKTKSNPVVNNPSMIRSKLSRIIEPGDRILCYDRAQGEDLYRLWDMVHTANPLTKEALVEIEGLLDDDGVLVIESGEEPPGLRDHFRKVHKYGGMLLVQGPMNPEEARINTEKLRRDLE